jgi:[ribosomal protein S18]-alanine N-acetyltransferase
MSLFSKLKKIFLGEDGVPDPIAVPLSDEYFIHPLRIDRLDEVVALNARCFLKGENYNQTTFGFLLNDARNISYMAVNQSGTMIGFIFIMRAQDDSGHITTIGIAPEHRRRGLAKRLLDHAEESLRKKGFSSVALEVRVSNHAAQELYLQSDYVIVQTLRSYYNDGEDGYLMMKALEVWEEDFTR